MMTQGETYHLKKVFSTVPPSLISPSPKKVSTPPPHSPKKMLLSPPKHTLPKPPAEVIAAVFPSTFNILSKSMSPPRTKGDIMGYSSDESSEEDSSESEESITSKSGDDNENVDLEVEEFILPDTVEGIRDRFNELFVGFARKGKHENRNELEFLVDELLRQGVIDPTEYTQLNTRLTEEEDLTIDKEEEEGEEEDEEEENMTNAAIQYLILHDKEELQDLIKDEIDGEFMDIVLDIEKLLEEFL